MRDLKKYLINKEKKIKDALKLIDKKPIVASKHEINENLPSRSAKLRYAIKSKDFYNFDTDICDQFKNLIEIENYGNKL